MISSYMSSSIQRLFFWFKSDVYVYVYIGYAVLRAICSNSKQDDDLIDKKIPN